MVGLARGGSGSDSGIGSDSGWEWEVEGGRDGGCDREGVVVWRRLLPSLAQAPVDPFIEGKCGQCISYELKGGQGGVGRGVWCYQGWGVLWALWRV